MATTFLIRLLSPIIFLSILACAEKHASPFGAAGSGRDTSYISAVPLEEDSIPIFHISSATISPSGSLLALSDESSGHVFLYNLKTGALLKSFIGTTEFVDSLAIEAAPYDSNLRFLTLKDLHDSLGESEFRTFAPKWLRNTYTCASFSNDSTLLLLGVIQGVLQNINGAYQRISHGQTALFTYGITSNKISTTPFSFLDRHYMAQPHSLLPVSDGTVAASIVNEESLPHSTYDSMWTIGYFDKLGHPVRSIFPMPDEYRNGTMAYNALNISIDQNPKTGLVATCLFSPAIFDLSHNKRHSLDSLPLSNADGLAMARRSAGISPDSLIRELPVRLMGLKATTSGDNIVSVQLFDKKTNETTWLMQIYSSDMRLVKQRFINIGAQFGEIEYVIPASDKLIAISLTKSGTWMAVTCNI
jgi:hypothetical protein